MATFNPIPYTYVPMALRFKSTKTPYNRTPTQVSILDKIQRIKGSGAALSTPQPSAAVAAANDSRNDRPGIRKTSTVHGGNDKEEEDDDDDDDLPTIEGLLYTTLKKEGFATEDSSLDRRVQGVEEGAGSIDCRRSASGDSLGSSRDNPIFLLEDDKSNAFDSEVADSNLRAENARPDAGSSSSPEIAVNSRPLAPSSLDRWYDINNYPKTVQRLRLAEGALTSNSICPYNPSSCLSSELLHDHIDTDSLDTHCTRSEAATSHSARSRSPPPHHSRASTGNRLRQEDRLHAGRSTADEHKYEDELVRPALNTDTFDKGEKQQQAAEAEAEAEVNKDDDRDDGQVQQAANGVAAAVMAKRIGDNHPSGKEDGSPRLAERQWLLPSCDPSPEPGHDETGSGSNGNSNKTDLDEDNGRLRPAKRQRRSSSYDGPMLKKRKHHLQQRSTHQRAEMLIDCYNLGRSFRDVLPTLVEVTFCPHSPHYCSFTAVVQDSCDGRGVSFSQLARLVENIGHIRMIDDFLIKPLEQHSFLLTGFSYIASRLLSSRMTMLTATKTSPIRRDAVHILLQHGKAVDTKALASHGDELSSSDDDSDLSPSSDNDGHSSEDELGRLRTSKHNRWSDLDEQRLLAYKKEGKSWDWIFGKFPGRARPAICTRWNMVRPRDK